jgi:hypothetical protein
MEVSKVFCFQLSLLINGKTYKFLYSTVHKTQKTTSQGVLQMPLEMKSAKWSVIVIDLYDLYEKYKKVDEIRLNYKLIGM